MSQYIRKKNPLHKQSEKPACASKQDMLELTTLRYMKNFGPIVT